MGGMAGVLAENDSGDGLQAACLPSKAAGNACVERDTKGY